TAGVAVLDVLRQAERGATPREQPPRSTVATTRTPGQRGRGATRPRRRARGSLSRRASRARSFALLAEARIHDRAQPFELIPRQRVIADELRQQQLRRSTEDLVDDTRERAPA